MKEQKTQDVKFKLLAPFGPKIGMIETPNLVRKNFETLKEKTLIKKNLAWNSYLVGQIWDEWHIPPITYDESGVKPFIYGAISLYVKCCLQEKNVDVNFDYYWNKIEVLPEIQDGWVNVMKEFEYNPAHYHPNCDISTIFWFEQPDYASMEKITDMHKDGIEKELKPTAGARDGGTDFLYQSQPPYAGGLELQASQVTLQPIPGAFCIFPGYLYHMVYPFKGKNEKRVSMSVNMKYKVRIKDRHMGSKKELEDYFAKEFSQGEVPRWEHW